MLPFFARLSVAVDYFPSANTRLNDLSGSENQLLLASFVGNRYASLITPYGQLTWRVFESALAAKYSILSVTEPAKLKEVESELKAESRRLIALDTCHSEITFMVHAVLLVEHSLFSLNIFSSPLFTEQHEENERKDRNVLFFFLSKNVFLYSFFKYIVAAKKYLDN